MSLWTPDGEHSVPREAPRAEPTVEPDDDPLAGLTDEQREQAMAMAAEMEEVRQQLASVPAAVVIANHAMGLYELAAIHLSTQPPNFPEAQVAIDLDEAPSYFAAGRPVGGERWAEEPAGGPAARPGGARRGALPAEPGCGRLPGDRPGPAGRLAGW